MDATKTSGEKSPDNEKTSYDLQEVAVPQLPASGSLHSSDGTPPKRRLPYRWQLAMILLTCFCTCEYPKIALCPQCADSSVQSETTGQMYVRNSNDHSILLTTRLG